MKAEKIIHKKYLLFIFILMLFNQAIYTANMSTIQFAIIVPINPEYDSNSLKNLEYLYPGMMSVIFPNNSYPSPAEPSEVAKAYDIGSREYEDYLEIFERYYPNYDAADAVKDYTIGEMLVGSDGYYYPTVSLQIGTGNTTDLITMDESLQDYYMLDETGEITTDPAISYARVYSCVIESNNVVLVNGNSNVKYTVAYRSVEEVGGVDIDVQNIVQDESGGWLWLDDDQLTDTTLETAEYTTVVNGMSRKYFGTEPVYDTSLKTYTHEYYQDLGTLSMVPLNPDGDSAYYSLIEAPSGMSGTLVDALYPVNNTSDFYALVEGRLVSTDAVYYAFVDTDINTTEYTLGEMDIEVYRSDGVSGTYDQTSAPIYSRSETGLLGLVHNFSFEIPYETMLQALDDPVQGKFDIVMRGKSDTSTIERVLDGIVLPVVRVNSVSVSNGTTLLLWTSMGFSADEITSYSNADFTNPGNSLIQLNKGVNDGNYAKAGDALVVVADYDLVLSPEKYRFDKSLSLLVNGVTNDPLLSWYDPLSGKYVYTFYLNNFTGNGAAYITAGSTDEDSERIKVLYIDNQNPSGEGAAATKQYINDSSSSIIYSSNEEGKGSTEEDLTSGLTGTRAYINIFSYNSDESDISTTNPDITGTPHKGTSIADAKYYRAVLENNGSFDDVILTDISGHTNDGGYHINKVMAVDKAGNVETTNKIYLPIIVLEADSSGAVADYYVDTINPLINASFKKTGDLHPELDSAFGLPQELPFKHGDDVELSLNVVDYNLDTYDVDENGISITDDFSFPVPNTSTLSFTVENLTTDDTGAGYAFYIIRASDKAGNSSLEAVSGHLLNTPPSNIALERYEDYKINWMNSSTGISGISSLQDPEENGYSFSKGSLFSGDLKPDIYITGQYYSGIDKYGSDKVQLLRVDLNGDQVYYNHGILSPGEDYLNLDYINTKDASINDFYLQANSKNTVTVTPYGASGVMGNDYIERIVIDTDVNSDSNLMSNGSYISSSGKYSFDLDFSQILELAGLTGYKINKITVKNGGDTKTTYDNTSSTDFTSLTAVPSTTLTTSNVSDNILIDKGNLVPGSRSTLYVDVIDALGSEKEVQFTLLVPEPSIKLKAKTTSSDRVMESDVKIVGETIDDKGFEVETVQNSGN